MTWRPFLTDTALRDLKRLDRQTAASIREAVTSLLIDLDGPHQPPPGTKLLRHVKPPTHLASEVVGVTLWRETTTCCHVSGVRERR
jgi:hypothetical protein